MACIKDSANTVIVANVTQVLPGYKTAKVVQQLLSGAHHVQIIGQGARIVTITLFADDAGKAAMDTAESTGATVKVEAGTKYYSGVIEAAPSWAYFRKGLYSTTIVLLVSEDGDIA